MTPTIAAFERSPDRGQGLARDMRIRWALEEVGQPYDVRLLSFNEMKEPAHRALTAEIAKRPDLPTATASIRLLAPRKVATNSVAGRS
jgi:hypothetical protein